MDVSSRDPARRVPVSALARDALGQVSASERKVARALLSAYPMAGLETVAQLAVRAGVSPPTVVRFVARLGFAGYPAFQKALIHEVHERMGSPLAQYAEKGQERAGQELLPFVSSTFVEMIAASFEDMPAAEFARAVDLVCDRRLGIHLVGGRFSRVLADYLTAHLQLLRSGVFEVPDDEFSRLALTTDAGRSQVLIVFDYRRYELGTVRLAEVMSSAGARVVLLTDRWLSPIAEFADVVLPARVESPSPFDSLVPALALVESLITAVTDKLGPDGRQRVELLERKRGELYGAASPVDGVS